MLKKKAYAEDYFLQSIDNGHRVQQVSNGEGVNKCRFTNCHAINDYSTLKVGDR